MTLTDQQDSGRPADGMRELEKRRFDLERAKYRSDLWKWVAAAAGAVLSFIVLDYGRLRLERFRATSENERALLQSYLTATESPQPDIWKRKLRLLMQFGEDTRLQAWAKREFEYVRTTATRILLLEETIKVAGQLIERTKIASPERHASKARFEQLYWAELPFFQESKDVEGAMVRFREALSAAEAKPEDDSAWNDLNQALLKLSKLLRTEVDTLESQTGR